MNDNYERQTSIKAWNSRLCSQCKYVGICSGGCRYLSYLNEGSLEAAGMCKKMYYKLITENYMQIKYQGSLSEDEKNKCCR